MAIIHISFEKFKNYSFIFDNISKNDILKKELAEYGYSDKEIANFQSILVSFCTKIEWIKKTNIEMTKNITIWIFSV